MPVTILFPFDVHVEFAYCNKLLVQLAVNEGRGEAIEEDGGVVVVPGTVEAVGTTEAAGERDEVVGVCVCVVVMTGEEVTGNIVVGAGVGHPFVVILHVLSLEHQVHPIPDAERHFDELASYTRHSL